MGEIQIIYVLGFFVLLYPLCMSIIWTVGAIIHYYKHEKQVGYTNEELPFCSILVPAYNEMENIHDVIDRMHKLNYPNYEIIVINDGSKDKTADLIESIIDEYPKLRFVNSVKNMGKAHALHLGLLASKGEYLVCIDADSYIDNDALIHLIAPMLDENNGSNVGAVTGNPRVRNRTNLLSKLQTAEYSSVIGMIKRTQQLSYSCMTLSGVCVAFKKQALIDCGLWDKDMIAEDIAVTWKLHEKKWRIIYNPYAICWMLVPTKINGLFKQRVRWAQGGIEVLFRHFFKTIKRRDFRNFILLLDQILGIIWAFLYVLYIPVIITSILNGNMIFLTSQVKILILISLFNYLIAFFIERKYDKQLFATYTWVIWYPIFYWRLNVVVLIVGFYKVLTNKLFGKKVKHAIWESPDRGDLISNGVSDKRDIIEVAASKKYKTVALPITLLLWLYFIIVIKKFLVEMTNSILNLPAKIIYTIVSNKPMEYHFFLFCVVFVLIMLVYFYYAHIPFPTLKKHSRKVNSNKKLEKIFDIDDVTVYQNMKEITFEDETYLARNK